MDYTKTIWEFFRQFKSFISEKKLNEENHNTINVYPNPADEKIYIDYKSENPIFIQIIDINGKVVYTGMQASDKTVVDVTDFKPGLYNIILSDKSVEISKKILILHKNAK
ncbi:MAG: hypothetical protein Kow0068_26190 [Marinilabiliales bacterium]